MKKKKKKTPNKKTVTHDEIKAYPTRRTVLPFRIGESTSEAHRTRSRSRRPREEEEEEEEEEEDHHHRGGLLLLLSHIVRFLFRERVSVSGVLFFIFLFFLLNPKKP